MSFNILSDGIQLLLIELLPYDVTFTRQQKSSGVKSFVQITQDLKPYMGQ